MTIETNIKTKRVKAPNLDFFGAAKVENGVIQLYGHPGDLASILAILGEGKWFHMSVKVWTSDEDGTP